MRREDASYFARRLSTDTPSWVPACVRDLATRAVPGLSAFPWEGEVNAGNAPALFGNSSWYFNAASRGRFCLLEQPRRFSTAIAPSWTRGRSGAWKHATVVIRPIVQAGNLPEFVTMLKHITCETKKPVILKQVGAEMAESLSEYSVRGLFPQERWSDRYRLDEHENPEVVCCLQKFPKSESAADWSSLSKQARRAWNQYRVKEIRTSEYGRSTLSAVRKVFAAWILDFRRRHPGLVDPEFALWYQRLISSMRIGADIRLFIGCRNDNQDPKACFFLTRSGDWQWDMALSFFIPGLNDLHRLLYLKTMAQLRREGTRFVNLGGSEERNLYLAKKRICPSLDLKTTIMVMDPVSAKRYRSPPGISGLCAKFPGEASRDEQLQVIAP